MTPPPAEQDTLISHFCAITGVSPAVARTYLENNQWSLDHAVAEFYPEEQESDSGDDQELLSEQVTGRPSGQTLGGGAPATAPSAKPPAAKPQKKKFATLHDLGSGDAAGNEPDDDEDGPPNLFTGGEKSGLAVQNPDDLKKKIIEKAKKALPRGDDSQPKKSYFTGTARTLGGDDAPSRTIEDPNANRPEQLERVNRTLHFWNDGFSVDDGDLYRSDDPRNADILESIRQGQAPLAIMNVQPGQYVDVEVKQHDTNYVKPKAKYKPFSGAGQRLGSPTPVPGTRTEAPTATTRTVPTTATEPEKPKIDNSQPTVTLQIRLGDGTRLTSRFNTTHTIGDVYDFVAAASPVSRTRSWVLMTTFPSTELSDKSAVLGELKEYQRGGVVVQKWVLSGKGGVGKSSVTLQLALTLSLQGRSVGILDVDLTGPSIPRLVGLEDAKITQAPGGWLPVTVHPAHTSPPPPPPPPPPHEANHNQTAAHEKSDDLNGSPAAPTTENTNHTRRPRGSLRCMSLGFLLRDRGDAVIWRGPKKTAMIRQFLTDVLWADTDYLLIDTPPGTSDEHIALAEQLLTLQQQQQQSASRSSNTMAPRLAGAVLVTTPQAVSTADVRKEINFCVKTRIPVLGVIENMSGYTCPCCGEVTNVFSRGGGQIMAQETGVRFLGAVPIDVGFGEMVEGWKEDSVKQHGEKELTKGEQTVDHSVRNADLLVERYKRCWSFPIFEKFALKLIELIES
ncbi:protein phosphatase regulator [Emydomyces testavorans]|uniref:Protein phosphatase regulator n=1 Tax=Emydomyces testavorans TaxID=2070801 RepID=A0AAF0IGT7_9EURO|nr:protein phosphatase regulator [Emydomyces testavorans]